MSTKRDFFLIEYGPSAITGARGHYLVNLDQIAKINKPEGAGGKVHLVTGDTLDITDEDYKKLISYIKVFPGEEISMSGHNYKDH